jgi:hypothetical protein
MQKILYKKTISIKIKAEGAAWTFMQVGYTNLIKKQLQKITESEYQEQQGC